MNPYDELPYRSFPIEWSAPERLALVSLIHGGPRLSTEGPYRVLELGCGNGANLLPLAYFRRGATFLGIDSAGTQINSAERRRATLRLENVQFMAVDFRDAARAVQGPFDFILAHGVFSWISIEARDALIDLCAGLLKRGGLLYVNYNTLPGWSVRGLVRTFLMSQTSGIGVLRRRTQRARALAARMTKELRQSDHWYSQLLANEFSFVTDNLPSYTAHEYLTEFNRAYSRREFLDLVSAKGLHYVADADFDRPSGRLPEELSQALDRIGVLRDTRDDASDLLCYRQLHSPVLTGSRFRRRLPASPEWRRLFIASPMTVIAESRAHSVFRHPSGLEINVTSDRIVDLLARLASQWPEGLRIGDFFTDVDEVIDDLRLLQRCGVLDLRLPPPLTSEVKWAGDLHRLQRRWGRYTTNRHHVTSRLSSFTSAKRPPTC